MWNEAPVGKQSPSGRFAEGMLCYEAHTCRVGLFIAEDRYTGRPRIAGIESSP